MLSAPKGLGSSPFFVSYTLMPLPPYFLAAQLLNRSVRRSVCSSQKSVL